MKKVLIILLLFYSTQLLLAQDWRRIIDLRGQWKFSLGDDIAWAESGYDDSNWESIFAPAAWEDEGFPGYDGYAWYRKTFRISTEDMEKNIYLRLWQIDDVDEVYINGVFIGFSGSFPPDFFTAYRVDRIYRIPKGVLNNDKDNIISIRVFDEQREGGILRGRIGIYEKQDEVMPDIPLDGAWKFMPGDDENWKEYDYIDDHWHQVMVPASWETQGFKDYNGFAWYRLHVVIPREYQGEELILLLGKIDDLDQTYLNGNLIGETGSMNSVDRFGEGRGEWLQWRAYNLDEKYIEYGRINIIAIRVFDGLIHGGIYMGPVGIITKRNFKNWRLSDEVEKRKKSFFELLFDD